MEDDGDPLVESDVPRLRARLADAAADAVAGTVGAVAQAYLGDPAQLGSRHLHRALRSAPPRSWPHPPAACTARPAGAITAPDTGLERLEQLAAGDAARLELLARVLEAAQRSTIPDKVEALGHVLASGLGFGDRVDEALVLAAALHDLEAPHVRVLAELHREPVSPVPASYPAPGRPGWTPEQLVAHLPGTRIVLGALLQVLRSRTSRAAALATRRPNSGATASGCWASRARTGRARREWAVTTLRGVFGPQGLA